MSNVPSSSPSASPSLQATAEAPSSPTAQAAPAPALTVDTEPRSPSAHKSHKPLLNPDEARRMLNEEHIAKLTETAFGKLAEYTRVELKATTDDCELLETMNKATRERYAQMSQMSQRLMSEITKLQGVHADFSTLMTQIDDIHQQSLQIEKIASALDSYSQHLERKLATRVTQGQAPR
ncbi:biogenesis of lysosome-related organelles complex-1 subunit 2-domain-containing protein [Syncephalastrum racemosum]|uniref:Biogenesis of lysosome-related organelles complex-1 subunit 2-domain-containing protein n=1 Tax=Syncephalastrum racemosum TaxID=13706 RepID=A0A1X2H847_SYNRA|nr:biogenesis of lysosome-related organelles complex-1 subunit 2-domain-containing protein [Syncephalastrum racemosum]